MNFKRVITLILISGLFTLTPSLALAAENAEISNFTNSLLPTIFTLASLVTTFFLIKGGYTYITSSGNPEQLVSAKKTLKNALIGLTIILAASTISSTLNHAFETPSKGITDSVITLSPIEPTESKNGLTRVFTDAVTGFLINFIQSSTKPLTDGIVQFLTSTPSVLTNSVIFNFWLITVGIADSIFVLIVCLLGFHVMSAASFGFDEVNLKQVLSKIFIAFLGANLSIFLIEWVITLSNVLTSAVINATGGLGKAWVIVPFDAYTQNFTETGLLTIVLMAVFILLSIILLLFYISRLIIVSLGVVLAPFVFLLWAIPSFAQFAELSVKGYLVTIFSIFIHVITIQLASSFLSIASQSGTNVLVSLLVSIGLFSMLLKMPGVLVQMVFYGSASRIVKGMGGQIVNVLVNRGTPQLSTALTERTVSTGIKGGKA